jgi:uncharacterized protein YbjT (DUF2867 family)
MYTVLGASGHIGSIITRSLLDKGEKVRVVGRRPGALQTFVHKGAESLVTKVTDAEGLVAAFSGVRAAFLMIPPNPSSLDYRADQERNSDAIASAVKKAGLQYAVNLSSIGAQAPAGTGPIAGLHNFEKRLNSIDKLNVLHLRPAYFFENHLASVGMIQMMRIYGSAIKPEIKFPQIATRDIGGYAADRLLKLDFNSKQTQELLGERDLSMTEVTGALSKALNMSDLRYVQFSYDQFEQALTQMGIPAKTATCFIEMAQGYNDGTVCALEPRTAANCTPTSIESFIKEVFLPAFHQQKAANA